MGTKIKSIIALMCLSTLAFGQDARYSQFYASPLTLNPAFTGLINSTYRVSSIFRSQGITLAAPMSTYSTSFDMNFGKKPFAEHYWGAGIMVMNDFSQNLLYLNNQIQLSGAFHKILSKRHMLSYGLQMGLGQTRFNGIDDLMLPDNVNADGNGFDTGIGDDTGWDQGGMNFDLNTGLAYVGKISRHSIFSGFSLYHLVPAKSGVHIIQSPLSMRISAHGGVKFKLLEQYRLTPHFVYQRQGVHSELNAGTNFEINIPDNSNPYTIVSFGSYFRMNGGASDQAIAPNALILMAGISIMDVNLGLAYDINMSDINAYSNHQYGFEISLAYEGMLAGRSKKRFTIGCPKW